MARRPANRQRVEAAAEPNAAQRRARDRPIVTLDELAQQIEDERREAHEKKRVRVTLYVHPLVARQIKLIAIEQGRKANTVYLDALDRYLVQQRAGSLKEIVRSGRKTSA